MHWFLRGLSSTMIGLLGALVAVPLWPILAYPLGEELAFLAASAVAFAVYNALTLRVYHLATCDNDDADADHETHCRRCGYILRGITEPRCPECGERI